jgi:SNF family Na+-dependent transporter
MITSHSVFSWQVFLACIAVWIIVYFCIWKGVNSSSYIVWVTVPLPCLFIMVMVVKGFTLPGMEVGVRMYLMGLNAQGEAPDWGQKLGQMDMWAEAMGQNFFSLGICMGTMASYASFNPKNKPIIGDTFTICLSNSLLSFIAGFAVFTVMGYLITVGSPVSDKLQSIGLAFVSYPAAIELMKGANFWAVIFGLTLFMLGIDSSFSTLEATSTVFHDTKIGMKTPRKLVALVLCVCGVIFSLVYCFNWGFTMFDVVDHYLNVYLMLLMGVLECLAVGWIYEAEAIMKKVNKATVISLFVGYWVTLIVAGILTFTLIPEKFYYGMLAYWLAQIITIIVSWRLSGLSYK